jgi:hypothetical protein
MHANAITAGVTHILLFQVGAPLCRAMLAYQRGNYVAVCETLLPLRQHAYVIGGSHAQRDVISLTLMEAALRSAFIPSNKIIDCAVAIVSAAQRDTSV